MEKNSPSFTSSETSSRALTLCTPLSSVSNTLLTPLTVNMTGFHRRSPSSKPRCAKYHKQTRPTMDGLDHVRTSVVDQRRFDTIFRLMYFPAKWRNKNYGR